MLPSPVAAQIYLKLLAIVADATPRWVLAPTPTSSLGVRLQVLGLNDIQGIWDWLERTGYIERRLLRIRLTPLGLQQASRCPSTLYSTIPPWHGLVLRHLYADTAHSAPSYYGQWHL
jgi:hypothetical protein